MRPTYFLIVRFVFVIRFPSINPVLDTVKPKCDDSQALSRQHGETNDANRPSTLTVVVRVKHHAIRIGKCVFGLTGCDPVLTTDVLTTVSPIQVPPHPYSVLHLDY